MRYSEPIFFQIVKPGEYDEDTGNYGDDTIIETKRFASVTDSGVETMKLIYDGIKQGTKTIRLQRAYTEPFDSIRIGNKVYKTDFSRFGKIFVVSGVM